MNPIEKEKKTVAWMIAFYCRHKEKNKTLCKDCQTLTDYAHQRLEKCPFSIDKKSCNHCPIHCYHPKMRAEIKEVMRYTGPRMLFFAPLTTLRHWVKW